MQQLAGPRPRLRASLLRQVRRQPGRRRQLRPCTPRDRTRRPAPSPIRPSLRLADPRRPPTPPRRRPAAADRTCLAGRASCARCRPRRYPATDRGRRIGHARTTAMPFASSVRSRRCGGRPQPTGRSVFLPASWPSGGKGLLHDLRLDRHHHHGRWLDSETIRGCTSKSSHASRSSPCTRGGGAGSCHDHAGRIESSLEPSAQQGEPMLPAPASSSGSLRRVMRATSLAGRALSATPHHNVTPILRSGGRQWRRKRLKKRDA